MLTLIGIGTVMIPVLAPEFGLLPEAALERLAVQRVLIIRIKCNEFVLIAGRTILLANRTPLQKVSSHLCHSIAMIKGGIRPY